MMGQPKSVGDSPCLEPLGVTLQQPQDTTSEPFQIFPTDSAFLRKIPN
jgi:hypothetical protein